MWDILEGLQHWLEIDLDKLAANLREIKGSLGDCGLIAVVKNDAYGFGAPECARTFMQAGADILAVTTLEEALELREAEIGAPVLVFLPPMLGEERLYAEYRLTATVDSLRAARLLREYGQNTGQELQCHLKVNCGMNRFGVNPGAELAAVLEELAQPGAPGLLGVYAHMATALEPEEKFAREQIRLFNQVREQVLDCGGLTEAQKELICFHLANSAGGLRFPEARFSAVRMGSALYGQLLMAKKMGLNLQEPFVAKARISAIRTLKKGDGVGYSQEYHAGKAQRLAVIPYGYGDGFGVSAQARELTVRESVQTMSRNIGKLVLGRGQRGVYYQDKLLPVLGRVAMQSMMVDIGDLPLEVGDEVSVPLRRTAASARLPRVYLEGGRPVSLRVLTSRSLSREI